MFLRNRWYVIAWSREVAQLPLSRTVMGEPIVLFRDSGGKIAALQDHCPHRHLPLSMGKVQGDHIQCAYHGLTFNASGTCVRAPNQDTVPPQARVTVYPSCEKHSWVWVWMGEPGKADESLVPDFSRLVEPGYKAVGKTNYVRSDYRLVTDNLMDLSHVGFVHTSTIGNPEMGEKGRISVSPTRHGIRVTRLVPDVPPPPTYIKTGVLPEGRNIDRWQVIDFVAPCFVMIHVGGAEAGTGALEGRYEHGLNQWIMNAMTPETAQTTHYFWATVRCHAIDDLAADELFLRQVSEAFDEDRVILEAQQKVLAGQDDNWSVALRADAGCMQARRFLQRMIVNEQAGQ